MNDTHIVKPWYRQFWPWFIIALPTTTVIASIITIWIALNNETKLVTDTYYQEGVSINIQLERERLAKEAKIQTTILFSDTDQLLSLFFQGEIKRPTSLTLSLSSAQDPSKDVVFELKPVNQNLYQSSLVKSPTGKFYISLLPANKSWRIKGEIVLPSDKSISIPTL